MKYFILFFEWEKVLNSNNSSIRKNNKSNNNIGKKLKNNSNKEE